MGKTEARSDLARSSTADPTLKAASNISNSSVDVYSFSARRACRRPTWWRCAARSQRDAKIEDDGLAGMTAAMEALTPQQVGETITLMLEKNPSLLDREPLAEFGTILGGSRADGEYVPLRVERMKEVPRLSGGQVGS